MGGKAKPTKHSAREIKRKTDEATQNKGGGKRGLEDRRGGSSGHSKFLCYICKQVAPDLKSMQFHHEAKHSKIPFEQDKYENMHEKNGGVTTTGFSVRGSKKK